MTPRGTCLLLGVNGQVGYELTKRVPPTLPVVAYDRTSLDLMDASAIRDVIRSVKPRMVINAAAYTAVDQAETEVDECWAVNAAAPQVLAEEAARVGAGVVHFSTDYVFDGTKATPYLEEDETNPLSVYGRAKLAGEAAIARSGAPYIILRTSWVYALRGKNFVRTILKLAREREELRIVADQHGAPTWSRDIAEATFAILSQVDAFVRPAQDSIGPVSGVYHLTSSGTTSWYEFAQAILALDPDATEQTCKKLTPVSSAEYPVAARRPLNSSLDCGKVERVFGGRVPDWRQQLRIALTATG